MKRLPSNAEASNVLVGEVDFLEKPIAAFIRLSNSCVIGDLTEVPIPTRFVFVMLGPAVSQGRYHEIGRAISTLMADDVGILQYEEECNIPYKAAALLLDVLLSR